ncbi:hypothetical protein ACTHPH_21695 [Paenibacillus pasadenensis]|uniref:hypothetical protein n=1 Tax=Paenibacillus pasadenensis TaxID=217090 RepID=UPI000491CB7C|nr:hypothetical protein [Paenibacillus pasadenensis]
MAKYYITHTCGHGHEHVLFGKNTDRERILKSQERSECPDCVRAKNIANAKANALKEGLSDLKGTEKQTEWAEQIRIRQLPVLKALYKAVQAIKPPNEDGQKLQDWMIRRVQEMMHTLEAAWWIETRTDELATFRSQLMKEAKAWGVQQGLNLGGGTKS